MMIDFGDGLRPSSDNITNQIITYRNFINSFKENPVEFYKHYHLRSNIESTFSMIKRKFGAKLYTKNLVSQTNELYLKCICHNISVLIHSIFELGIDINLNKCAENIPAQQLTI